MKVQHCATCLGVAKQDCAERRVMGWGCVLSMLETLNDLEFACFEVELMLVPFATGRGLAGGGG